MVRDADDVVAAVSFRDSEARVSITRLPGGIYASLNELEGDAVIRCHTGREINLGYTGVAFHLRRTVRAADCAAPPS